MEDGDASNCTADEANKGTKQTIEERRRDAIW
jgi:hypothetical protein